MSVDQPLVEKLFQLKLDAPNEPVRFPGGEWRRFTCGILGLPETATDEDLIEIYLHVEAQHHARQYYRQMQATHAKREAQIRARLEQQEAQP